MKPLEKGRRALIWLGIHFADDEPVSDQLKLTQKAFSIIYAVIFMAFFCVHSMAFLTLRFVNPQEFFLILVQYVMMIHGSTAFITIYSCSSCISKVFQSLTQIYEKCKPNDKSESDIKKSSIIIQLDSSDPDERLTAINDKFECIYGYSRKAMKQWIFIITILPSVTTILLCRYFHGGFDVAYPFHPIRIR